MKQIDECLVRLFEGKKPLQKKWQARVENEQLYIFHYHHLVLIYRLDSESIEYEWWERRADKRGLDSAKEWLMQRKRV